MDDRRRAWQARYGGAGGPDEAAAVDAPAPDALAAWNPLLERLLGHRSVRAYLDRPLPAGTLEALVAAAQSAATSSNLQAWSVVAVESVDRRARLAELVGGQKHVAAAPLFLVWLADLSRLEQLGRQQGRTPAGLDYLELLLVGVIDAALAAQNAVVALESLDLACVYIGGIRNRPLEVAAELALPPRVFPVFGLCVGHADPRRPAAVKPRLPQAAVLHREQYSPAATAGAVARYDATLALFHASQGMSAPAWSTQAVDRVATPEALTGRQHLVDVLHRLGFPLA